MAKINWESLYSKEQQQDNTQAKINWDNLYSNQTKETKETKVYKDAKGKVIKPEDYAAYKKAQEEAIKKSKKSPGIIENAVNTGKGILKTAGNIATNTATGMLKAGENFYDFTYDTGSKINRNLEKWVGLKNQAEYDAARKADRAYVSRDLTNETLSALGWTPEMYKQWEQGSGVTRNNAGGQISQAVGGMAPALVVGNLAGAGTGTYQSLKGLSTGQKILTAGKNIAKAGISNLPTNTVIGSTSYGGALEEAYKNGASDSEATKYAIGKSAMEIGSEWLTGGIPGLKSTGLLDRGADFLIDKATGKVSKEATKGVLKSILKAGYEVAGEGAEEGLTEILTPILKNATYSQGQKINWNDVIQSTIIGGLTGGILNLPNTASNIQSAKQLNNTVQPQKKDSIYRKIEQDRKGLTINEDRNIVGNGIYTKNQDGARTITINPNSPKATEFILMHELSHDLSNTPEYNALKQTILDYDKNITGFEEARANLTSAYKNIYTRQILQNNPNINQQQLDVELNKMLDEEATNDVLGTMLSDQNYINNLSTKQPNIFQKIYRWISDMLKRVSGKENKFLQDIKLKFEGAYRQSNASQTGNRLSQDQDYFMYHRPTEGPQAFDLLQENEEISGPKDIYKNPQYYTGSLDEKGLAETMNALNSVKGNPNANIKIYRATIGNSINDGDWITLSKRYAVEHNEGQLDGKGNILEKIVKAKDIKWALDDLAEWGYFPSKEDSRLSKSENGKWQERLTNIYEPLGIKNKQQTIKILPTKEQLVLSTKPQNRPILGANTQNGADMTTEQLQANGTTPVPNYLQKFAKSEPIESVTPQFSESEYNANIKANEDAVKKYGKFEPGMQPRAREVEIAKKTEKGKTSRFFRSVAESEVADERIVNDIKSIVGSGEFAYTPLSDEKSVTKANNMISNIGYEQSVNNVRALFNSDKRVTKNDIALAERLIQEAKNRGDYQTASDLIIESAIMGTELGQSVQAYSIIKKLSPEGRLRTIQKIIQRENTTNRILQKQGKKVELSPQDAENILKAQGQEELENAVTGALENVSAQLPLTKADKIRSWRYLAMLANLRTHFRNVLSNMVMYSVAKVKNKTASFIEDIVKPSERNRTFKKASEQTKDFVKQDTIENRGRIQGQDKYDLKSQLNLKKRAFDNKILNKVADFNSSLLEKEDWFFSSRAYKDAMSNYITANNIDTNKITTEQLEKARQYGIKQAQETTFRQVSELANALSRLENTNAGSKLLVGATLPFKKTPINIAKTGVEYSPVSIIKSVNNFTKDVIKNGKATANSIDTLSKGLTGTGITLLGMWLASQGILRGAGADNDKEEYFQQNQGEQPYSINILGNSYTLDWLSPSAMPLFSGVEFYNLVNGKEKIDTTLIMKMGDALSKITDPLTEMSMLQGVNQTLQSYNSSETPVGYLGAVGLNALQNYAGQFIPTLSGQTARTIDNTRRSTTGEGKGLEKVFNTFVNKQKAKIPGLSQTLEPYTDIYGREQKTNNPLTRAFQNFISPGYLKEKNTTKADKEIQKLYDLTGEKSILPTSSMRYFTVDGKKINLTSKEYTQFNKNDGKYVLSELDKLFKNSAYKRASDEQKQKAIESIYRAGQEVAKRQYLKDNK